MSVCPAAAAAGDCGILLTPPPHRLWCCTFVPSADLKNLILLNEPKQEVLLRLTVPDQVHVFATVAPATMCFCLCPSDVLAVSISTTVSELRLLLEPV